MSTARTLVVNADDLGLSPGVSRGILEAQEGLLVDLDGVGRDLVAVAHERERQPAGPLREGELGDLLGRHLDRHGAGDADLGQRFVRGLVDADDHEARLDELRDMTRWSNEAARTNNSDWRF